MAAVTSCRIGLHVGGGGGESPLPVERFVWRVQKSAVYVEGLSVDYDEWSMCEGALLQMELQAVGPSIPSFIHDEEGNVIDSRGASGEPVQFVFEEIHWHSQISREEAARRLEVTLYPFKKVSYLPFLEAFDRAKAENKLVHSILLWGALDDQSC
nr:PREDICTED: selenoprotein N-like [Lepisosteus oculatus]